jgi:hypothetical protein
MATGDESPRVYEVTPNFLRGRNGAVTSLTHPQNVRNIGAYYLHAGDKVFCAKATYQSKSKRWTLDSIQRIAEQKAPKLVRGARRKFAEDPIEVEMATNKKVYQPGERITLTLRAKNRTSKPVTLVFPTGETHAIAVYGGFNEVWRISTLDQATDQPKKMMLKPGQSIEFSVAWDQKQSDGKPAAAGRYFAGGKVISEGRAILPESRVLFRIKPAEGQQASADPPTPAN